MHTDFRWHDVVEPLGVSGSYQRLCVRVLDHHRLDLSSNEIRSCSMLHFPSALTFAFSLLFIVLTVLSWLVAPVVAVVVAFGADEGKDFASTGPLPSPGFVLPLVRVLAAPAASSANAMPLTDSDRINTEAIQVANDSIFMASTPVFAV
jgi:hypothetical protein